MQDNNDCGHGETLRDYAEMRLRFGNTLDLLMPEEGHALLLLSGRDLWDEATLMDALIHVMNENLDGDRHFRPSQRVVLTAVPVTAGAAIEHMLDEYWWVELRPVVEDGTGPLRAVVTGDADYAVLRVDQSVYNLPVGYDRSPRVTDLNDPTR